MTGVLRYIEQEAPHREITITDARISPLSLEDLKTAHLEQDAQFQLKVSGNLCGAIEGRDWPEGCPVTGNGTLAYSCLLHGYGLVPGGWLPVGPMQGAEPVWLLDQNAVSRLRGVAKEPSTRSAYQFMTEEGSRIHLGFALIEGGNGKVPTEAEIIERAHDSVPRLQELLPNTRIFPDPKDSLQIFGLCNIARDLAPRRQRWAAYFREVHAEVSRRKPRLGDADVSLLRCLARKHGVREMTFAFLALKSIACSNGRQTPAREILKFGNSDYTDALAHNAVADLIGLELLLAMTAMGQNVALVTADKNLAKFWCGLRPRNARFGPSLTYDVDLPAGLFLNKAV